MTRPLTEIRIAAPLLVATLLIVSCATAARETTQADSTPAGGSAGRAFADADVRFVRGMIHHHAQAIDMVELIADRTASESIPRLGHRIGISQEDEIARMERWLAKRGAAGPDEHLHGTLMPGMLTAEQMERLASARGAEFDRLFLQLMIQHHEGALVMVNELNAVEGAGQEPELYVLVSHINADQRAEIARMRDMLGTTSQGGNE